jgi:hypothetical protein
MPTITGFSVPFECALVPGGPIGQFNVPGNLKPGATLLNVSKIVDGAPPVPTDLTAEFSITSTKAGTIQNTTTVTTGAFLLVVWAAAS